LTVVPTGLGRAEVVQSTTHREVQN